VLAPYISSSSELVNWSQIVLNPVLTLSKALAGMVLGSATFLQALSLAYAYTYAQDNPTRQVSFFIITFDAKFLPFSMLFLTFIIDGPEAAMAQATGLVAAHLYDFLTRIWPTFGGGRNYITTPNIVKGWFGARPGSTQQRGYGTAMQGGRGGASAGTTGRTTGFSGPWNQMGPGRRLGD
jgi:Derlin-2/3